MTDINDPKAIIDTYEATKAGEAAAAGLKSVMADPDAPRMFLSPSHPTAKFLVQAGAVRRAPIVSGASIENFQARDGDVWVQFTAGVYALTAEDENYDVIEAWLNAHSGDRDAHLAYHTGRKQNARACQAPIGLCQESGEGVEDWLEMKSGQIATSRKDISVNPNLDVDGYFLRGRVSSHIKGGIGESLESAATNNRNAARARAYGKD